MSSQPLVTKNKLSFVETKSFSLLMFSCCIGYALFKRSYRGVGDIFEVFLILGSLILIIKKWKLIKKETIFWLIPLSILISFLSWYNSTLNLAYSSQLPLNLFKITYFLFFIFISIWLKGDIKRIMIFWGASAIGVFFIFLFNSPDFITDIVAGARGSRVDFSYVNANHPAALGGAVLVLSTIIFAWVARHAEQGKLWKLLILLLLMVFYTYTVIITQSRQVYLAVFIAVACAVIYAYRKKFKAMLLSLATFSIITIIFFNLAVVRERFVDEMHLLPTFLSFDIASIPYSSTGLRLHFLYEAVSWVKNNPILGLGHSASALVIPMSDRFPEYIKSNFWHLHNGFAEVLVNYGLLGLALFLFLFYKILRAQADKKYHVLFKSSSIAFLAYFCFINFFESYLSFKTGEYLFNCAAAGLYSYQMNKHINGVQNEA